MRIVSLVPSITETLLAWGIAPVACTRFCEQPNLLHVGGTKDPDIGRIVGLSPDLVVVDREENRREDAEEMQRRNLRVLDLHVTSVATAISETARLANLVGVDLGAVNVPLDRPVRVRAFVPIWRKPWMTISDETYGASLLASIGVGVSHAGSTTPYPEVSSAELRLLGAEGAMTVVLLPTEPYPFADRHVAEIIEATGISDVRIVDGRDLFWWGVRTHEARRRLADQFADLLV